MELVSAYLGIEQAHFEERLRVVEVPGGLRDVHLPSLVLQPLVENAIKHGTGHKQAGGSILCGRGQSGVTATVGCASRSRIPARRAPRRDD
jgi:two-component system LytT family sensor kinase